MRIAFEIRARQQRAVVQTSVIEFVGEDRVAAPGKCGEDADVGGIAGREQQRFRQADIGRQFFFQLVMRTHVPRHHVRCSSTQPVALQCAHRGFNHFRVVGEAQVIVARIRHHALAVDQHRGVLRAVDDAARAQLVGLGELGKLQREVGDGHGRSIAKNGQTLALARLANRK